MMMTEKNMNSACKTCEKHLPDLLLDGTYAASHPEVAAHLDACTSCRKELADLRATFNLLDEYRAPEPSAFFDTRLHARLREEVAAEPEGFWERMRSYFMYSTGCTLRPALAGALAVVLITGGAGIAGLHGFGPNPAATQASSAVDDLKVLDNNASAEQQMGQLLDQSGAEDGDSQPTT